MGDVRWQFELGRPLWLAALVVLPLLVYYGRKSLVRLARGQQRASLAVRIALVLLLIAALCGPVILAPNARQHLVLVADRVPGVPDERTADVCQPFAEKAAEVLGGGGCETILMGDHRDSITSAILAARVRIPSDQPGQIVLFSSGRGDAAETVAAALSAGVPISTVPLPGGPEHEVYVSSVRAPARVREGEPFYADVLLQSTHEGDGTLELLAGKDTVVREKEYVTKGENRFRFPLVAPAGPAIVLRAKITGYQDTIAENNQGGCVVLVGPRPRVLIVESQPLLAGHLAKALKAANIDVEVRPPEELPARLEDWNRYDLAIVANVPATSWPGEGTTALGRWVHEGGGLIVVGGDQAFTAGGYHGTPLEDVLPVVSQVRRPRPKPSLAMVLVLDISGSMEGPSIALAKQATRRAVAMLGPRDQIGVLAFEDQSHWVCSLHSATDKEQILKTIDTIAAGGGTSMYPAMERAYLALRDAYADLKHMIVETDGVSHPGDFDALVGQIAAAGISVSTVGLGTEPARPLLTGMAQRAKGHSYFCDKAESIPKIFEMATQNALREGIDEEPFSPHVEHAAQLLGGLDLPHAPKLLGYVETQPKPGSQTVLASPAGDPLLVLWHYGSGTSAAFTSDIQSRWAAAWLGWPGFARFWQQLARHAMRTDPGGLCTLDCDYRHGRIDVTLEAADRDGRFVNGAEAGLQCLLGNDAKPQAAGEIPRVPPALPVLPQVAPGRYAASLAADPPGTYYLETKLHYQGRLADARRAGLVLAYPERLQVRPTNEALLRAVAKTSGGRFNPKAEELFSAPLAAVAQAIDLTPYLLAAAVLVFLLDLVLKRIDLVRRGTK